MVELSIYQNEKTMTPIIAEISEEIRGLPTRQKNSHKGQFGHVVIAGGAPGMSGAIRLAGQGALRVGAGLVTLLTHEAHANFVNLLQPELMSQVFGDPANTALLEKATVLVVGPGLGQSSWSKKIFDTLLKFPQAFVLDADGLNLLSQHSQKCERWILTPHPGEAARLLGITTQAVQEDRVAAICALQKKYGGVVVLKGAGTLIANDQEIKICPLGNPYMASGGMGDLLTGIIAGLLAQGCSLFNAACLGVLLHARAGDRAFAAHGPGILASDLTQYFGVKVE